MTQAQTFTLFSALMLLGGMGALTLGVKGISEIATGLDRNLEVRRLVMGFVLVIAAVILAVNVPNLAGVVMRPIMPARPTNRVAALRYCESRIYSRFIACMEELNFSVTVNDR